MARIYENAVVVILIVIGSHHGEGIMSCLEARSQCYSEQRCHGILNMHHKICGPELAACSTVTPIKCHRLLLTLKSFEYFANCRCAETHMDYTCYTFRQTIFEHPCSMINNTGQRGHSTGMTRSSEAVPLLTTCSEAQKSCGKDRHTCFKDYMEFNRHCATNGNICLAKDREECYKAWEKVRHTDLFGCVCPPKPHMLGSVPNYGNISKPPPEDAARHASSIYGLNQVTQTDDNCIEIYNSTHNNPCLRKDNAPTKVVEEIQELCHMSLLRCQNDGECSDMLDKVMMWCEHMHCEPDRCRGALQNFYDSVSIERRLEVAFCVCRQNDNDGQCLTAMRKLHPSCAERHTGSEKKQCHEIAMQCRQNENCKSKLVTYEKNCAADAVTDRCSGEHRDCQHAVTNILGTELHASCVCKGTDFLYLQGDCYTWQKLLWSNPCVIESHLALQEEIKSGANLEEVFTRAPQTTSTPYSTSTSTMPPENYEYVGPHPTADNNIKPSFRTGRERVGPRVGGGYRQQNRNNWRKPGNQGRSRGPPPQGRRHPVVDNSTIDHAASNDNETIDACVIDEVVDGKTLRTWEIPVNSSIRRMREAGCSDMCRCQRLQGLAQPEVSCFALACINQESCNTSKAVFPHIHPYVQSFRGQCVCYSGNFICQRPPPDKFKMTGKGVYFLLGFSKHEVEIMKTYTLLNEDEALNEIQKLLKEKYGFKCRIVLKKKIGQNMIIKQILDDETPSEYEDAYDRNMREAEECTKPLQQFANWINGHPHNTNIHSDAYLSMFLMAEVHINVSEAQASQLSGAFPTVLNRVFTTILAVFPSAAVTIYWTWALTKSNLFFAVI